MRRFSSIIGYAALFMASFAFFLVLSFPYEVLKEAVANLISRETGFNVHINDLSPAFPLGIELENIYITSPKGDAELKVKEISGHLSLGALFLGRIGPRINIFQEGAGVLEFGANLGIFSLIMGEFVPRSIFLESRDFKLDDLFKFLMAWQASKPDTNPLFVGLLKSLKMSGNLKASVNLAIDPSNIISSDGKLVVSLEKAALKLHDADLAIKDQVLKKAFISATMKRGELAFDENSGLTSDGLDIKIKGKVKMNPNLFASVLEMLIDVKIMEEIKDNYGFLIDAITQRNANGEVKVQVRGPMAEPSVMPI